MEKLQEKIEDKVIDCINSGAVGRLIVFKPEKNSLGADLAVEERGNYKDKEIYFQVNGLVGHKKDDNFVKDFPKESFKTDRSLYLLFVYFDEIRQKINDFVWLVPSLHFRDIADVVKLEDGKSLFRFQASLDIKNKNKYSRYVVEAKQLGKFIMDAFGNKGRFVFKESDFEEKRVINLDSLKEFLCEARKNTYAGNATPDENPRLSSSVQFEFQKGDSLYRDVFFVGDKKFIGQEVIYQNLKPVWGMSYIGDSIGKLETNFLKEALFKLSEKCRLGGIHEYEKREFKYQDRGQGDFAEFSGREEMFLGGKNIYKLDYQGGSISSKI